MRKGATKMPKVAISDMIVTVISEIHADAGSEQGIFQI